MAQQHVNFNNNNNNWKQLGNIVFGENPGDFLGSNIDFNANGTRIIAGATGHRGVNDVENAGRVIVYELVNSQWTQMGDDFQGEVENGKLGLRVSMSAKGDLIAISQIRNNDNKGTIDLYKLSRVNTWELIHTIEGEDNGDEFSSWMTMSRDGSTIVGTPTPQDYIKIHKKHNGEWIEHVMNYTTKEKPSVSADGNRIAVIIDQYNGGAKEVAVIFDFNKNTSSWEEKSTIQHNNNLSALDAFNLNISKDGSVVVMGIRGDDDSNVGNTQVYRYENSSWNQVGQDIPVIYRYPDIKAISTDGNLIGITEATANFQKGIASIYSLNESNEWVKLASVDGIDDYDQCGNDMKINESGDFIVCSKQNDVDGGDNNEGCFVMYMNKSNIDEVYSVKKSLEKKINNKFLKMIQIRNYKR